MESLRSGDASGGEGTSRSLVSRSRRVPETSVETLFELYDRPRAVWNAPGEPAVAGCETAVTRTATGDRRVSSVTSAIETIFDELDFDGPDVARPRFLGGFSFHHGHTAVEPWEEFPAGWFFLPRIQLTRADGKAWLTVSSHGPNAKPSTVERSLDRACGTLAGAEPAESPSSPGIRDRTFTTSRESWHEQVTTALDRIERGDISKVVLAQSLTVTPAAAVSPLAILDHLATTYPDCFRFLVEPSDRAAFLGATPERLVSLSGRTLETEAIAGSTGRGDTPAEDEWLEADLVESEKDRHEHDLVVETISDRLQPFANDVEIGEMTVRQLATVQHLQTPLSATLSGDYHVLELVEALHPTPAVGGLPPAAASETILDTERFDRGWYAAPVGWIDANGDGTFAIAIRSAVLGDEAIRLFAGAGIVADSVPEREWDEVQLKYRPILDALERR